MLKAFKKEFCCNGTVVEDPEQGNVIQLQGDQRKNVSQFLINVRARARAAGWGSGMRAGERRGLLHFFCAHPRRRVARLLLFLCAHTGSLHRRAS